MMTVAWSGKEFLLRWRAAEEFFKSFLSIFFQREREREISTVRHRRRCRDGMNPVSKIRFIGSFPCWPFSASFKNGTEEEPDNLLV